MLAGYLRLALLPVALAAGIALQLLYPGDFGYRLVSGGPALATWIAAVGGALALVGGLVLKQHKLRPGRAELSQPSGRGGGLC